MFSPIAATPLPNNAASGITWASTPTVDIGAGEFLAIVASYEVANPTLSVADNAGFTWNLLTKQHDATDVKGHQILWLQAPSARVGYVATVTFSAGVGFSNLWFLRFKVDGTVSLVAQGTPATATASTTLTLPAVTGGMLHLASAKCFSSAALASTDVGPKPYGILGGNTSRSHQVFVSATPFSGTLTPSTGTWSAAQNCITISASFTDSGSPPASTRVPGWFYRLARGAVGKLPGLNISDAGLGVQDAGLVVDSATTFSAWSGGVGVSGGLYVGTEFRPGNHSWITGQGHTVRGNEVFAQGPFQADVPAWARLRDNTTPAPTSVEFDANGNPAATHGYSAKVYNTTGGINAVTSIGSKARYSDAGDINVPFSYNLSQATPNSVSPWSHSATTTGGWWWAVWDAGTAKYWGTAAAGSTEIRSWDPATDTFSNAYGTKSVVTAATPTVAAGDQSRGLLLVVNGGGTLQMFRPSLAATTDFYTPSTTGTPPTTISAVLWDVDDDCFVFLCSAAPNQLFRLTPPATNPYQGGNAWTWSSQPFAGDLVDALQANGTYGRFQRHKIGRAAFYTVTNSWQGATYAFRPASSVLEVYDTASTGIYASAALGAGSVGYGPIGQFLSIKAAAAGAALAATVQASATVTPALSTIIALSAAAQSQVTITASMASPAAALQAAVAAQASVAAALSTVVALQAAPQAVATVSASLNTSIAAAAQASGQCTVTAALTTAIRPAAAVQAQATVAAALSTQVALAAAASASTTVTATLAGGAAALQASLQAQATVGAALTTAIPLAASAQTVTTVTASLSGATAALQASAQGQCTVTAALSTAIPLAASAQAVTTVSATLAGGGAALQAAAQGQCTVTASLSTAIRLAAAVQGQATVTASLAGASAQLAAAVIAQAQVSAALSTQIALQAGVQAQATVSAGLGTAIRLAASVVAQCTVTSALTANSSFVPGNGEVWHVEQRGRRWLVDARPRDWHVEDDARDALVAPR